MPRNRHNIHLRCFKVGSGMSRLSWQCRGQHIPLSIQRRYHVATFLDSTAIDSALDNNNRRRKGKKITTINTFGQTLYWKGTQRRYVSWLPDAVQSYSIWGCSGALLRVIHESTGLPYWACFASISVGVRTMLFPLVIHAARTAARFAKVAPDVQFQVALFQRDLKKYREMKAELPQILFLMRANIITLSNTYKLHKINPFSIFLSPLCQMPILWYISVDLRKIVNGLDPMLAQQLVESPIFWVPDLTEPDPWYGLPIVAGLLLYANMEIAMGRTSLAGETASKADTAILLKDIFQSFAVFMPGFTSQLPGGIQIYLVSSFCFTMVQSAVLRTDSLRRLVGLPAMLAVPVEGRLSTQMVELKKLEQKARELRGEGPVQGKGVLMHGWELSFPGVTRHSTIQGSGSEAPKMLDPVLPIVIQPYTNMDPMNGPTTSTKFPDSTIMKVPINYGPYMYGVSAPPWQIEKQRPMFEEIFYTVESNENDQERMPHFQDDAMEKANRGESPHPVTFVKEIKFPKVIQKINVDKFMKKQKNKRRR